MIKGRLKGRNEEFTEVWMRCDNVYQVCEHFGCSRQSAHKLAEALRLPTKSKWRRNGDSYAGKAYGVSKGDPIREALPDESDRRKVILFFCQLIRVAEHGRVSVGEFLDIYRRDKLH